MPRSLNEFKIQDFFPFFDITEGCDELRLGSLCDVVPYLFQQRGGLLNTRCGSFLFHPDNQTFMKPVA